MFVTDIEAHLGLDGRFYVLDYARTFPPEAFKKDNPLYVFIIIINIYNFTLERYNYLTNFTTTHMHTRSFPPEAFKKDNPLYVL